ncbi:MAG: hypothetical protein FWD59_01770 [Micrococcales bacterium]|nr:hypothetical protein [Micrococcales bacterium]
MPDSGRSKSYSGRYAIEDAARPREVGDVRLALAAAIAASILAPNPEAVTPQATTAEDAQVTITSTTPILTSPDDILTVTATITNTGIAPFVGDINLRKANEPFTSLAELEAWATSGVEAEYAAWRVDADTTTKTDSPLQPGETRTVAFHVRTQLLALAPATYPWGPWGLLVDVETERGISLAVDRTFTVYAPPDKIGAPLELTTVAPLVARSGQSLAEAAYGAAEIALATVDAPVDWLLDPRLLGKSRPLDDALTSANRDKTLIALPWGDLDCSTLAHAANDARPLLAVADTLAEEAINTTLAPRIRFDLWWPEDAIDAELVHLTSSLPESPTLLGEPLAVPPTVARGR